MINILYCGNKYVFTGWILSTLTILKHTKDPISMYLFTMDLTDIDPKFQPISEEQVKFVEGLLKEVNKESKVTLFDVGQLFREQMIDSVNLKSHFTPYSMLRLFADEIDGIPDKLIYLDTDTMINRDLSLLFNQDIEDFEIACVKDAFNWASPSRWKIIKTYFNAGVLLLNMKMIRETKMFEKARNLCRYKKMLYMDQDALNRSVSKKKMLPMIFNSKDKYYPEIVVHHFCNVRKKGNWFHRVKPWEFDLVKQKMSAYNDIFDKYEELKKQPNFPK